MQVQEAARAQALVLVPVGVIEEHGPHMGLGADTYLAGLHCRRIQAALAAAGTKAVIGPPCYWGITDDTSHFPGSFNVRPETLTALLTDICRSLQSWGFRRLVFVSDHGNVNHRRTLKDGLAQARQELNVEAFSLDAMWTDVPIYPPPERPGRYLPDYHAGAAETAVMVKEFPAEVDVRRAEQLKPQPEFDPLGYVGDPAGFRQDASLIDFFLQAPEYDARRIRAFFKLRESKGADEARQTDRREIDDRGRAVIEAYLGALGGRERLRAVRTQLRHGELREGGGAIAVRGAWSAEGRWLLTLNPADSTPERFGFNGSAGWHAERGKVDPLPEPLLVALALAVDPHGPLRLERGLRKLTPPRAERLGDREVRVLEAATTSGMNLVLKFDAETGLLRQFNETILDDYREVGGVRFPFSITIKPGTEVRFDRLENNAPIEAVRFDPPE